MFTSFVFNTWNRQVNYFFSFAGQFASVITCDDNLTDASVEKKVCNSQKNDLRFTLYPIGLAISSIFLVATLVASYLLPASHHVLHWRCQTNHVACLLLGDLLLCITHLSGDCMSKTPCILIGKFLSAFLVTRKSFLLSFTDGLYKYSNRSTTDRQGKPFIIVFTFKT